MSRINVAEIKTERDTFANQIRVTINLCAEQEFTARHIIAFLMESSKRAQIKGEIAVRRAVRRVIQMSVASGELIAIRQGVAGDRTPGIYKRRVK